MAKIKSIHYGWVIVMVGFMVIFSCIGLGRYAYTMLLPSMQNGLGLSYDRMGFIGTGNFCGYLTAVIVAPSLIKRLNLRIVITGGLILITIALTALSQSHGFWQPCVLYILVGLGTGFANIPTMALISHWFRSSSRGKAAGLMIAGNGAAIMLAGIMVPALNRNFGVDGWRIAWLMLGVVALLVSAVSAWLVHNRPAEIGVDPIGVAPPTSVHYPVLEEHTVLNEAKT
jgi:sugar phosphate permease